ncbi:DUF676-domain-containing protein [Pleurotus eryngii]|uniref:DUF676-domain-containing protein n=1 Tax=Pleurotus eryngii TaxID=5323 RepID=A0A9P6A526_PLEER|nr:DUF676-domain-containing protein [Pleurotus eryngii]
MEPQKIHLLVLIHGMWGNPSHLAELMRVAQEKKDPNDEGVILHVISAETNRDGSTYDGIDWGGERVAEEITAEIARLEAESKKVTHFSITGYSLGGLLSRYVIGILHHRGFFEHIQPVNFNTIATPHIGIPRYPSFLSSVVAKLGSKLLSRTGEQFYCVDQWSTNGRPLLDVMADPEQIFYKALSKFQHLRIYANAANDITVPYVTGAIELEDPFADLAASGVYLEIDHDYPPLIKYYSVASVAPGPVAKPRIFSSEWFHSEKEKKRPLLPPHLMPRFPLNLLLYSFLPLLIPVGISLAIIRLSLDSRSSRARIRLLEESAKSEKTERQKLIHIIAQLEQEVEGAVVDIIDDTAAMSLDAPLPDNCGESGRNTPSEQASEEDEILRAAITSHLATTGDTTTQVPFPPPARKSKSRRCCSKHSDKPSGQPDLTPLQRTMVSNLNKLPIVKVLAYFEGTRNAHGVIICRDVDRFEVMRAGAHVVRHWADSLVL